MDGKQAGIIKSLQFRLSLALALAITITAVVGGVIGYQSAFRDANELQDDQLREVAAMVDAKRIELGQTEPIERVGIKDKESHVAIQVLDATPGKLAASSEPGVVFPSDLQDGMQTARSIGGKKWRIFVTQLKSGTRLAVGQRTALRNEIARHAAQRTVMPIVLLIPLLIVVVMVMLRVLLAPVNKLARTIDSRSPTDVEALNDAGMPSELKPFIASINQMLQRIETAMEQQRRFVADAAHELRSPLTALSLQAENLAINELSPEARQQLDAMHGGLLRARALVTQLLSLARAQLAAPDIPAAHVAVDLQSTVRDVFEEIMPFAEAKCVDLGLEQAGEVKVHASELELNTIVRNLVDNAIRYSGQESRVDVCVSVREERAVIEVKDNGPGIPTSERERVFEPFYRITGNVETGSGLGLSIVKSIVIKLLGDVAIAANTDSATRGTLVRVTLPLYRPPLGQA